MVEQLWSIKKYLCAFHSTKWEKGANANWHGCLFCSLASRVSICQWKWAMSNFSKHTLGSINNKYGIGKYFSSSSHSKHNYNCKLSRLSVKVFFLPLLFSCLQDLHKSLDTTIWYILYAFYWHVHFVSLLSPVNFYTAFDNCKCILRKCVWTNSTFNYLLHI